MGRFEVGGGEEHSSTVGDGDLAEGPIAQRFHTIFAQVDDPQIAGPELMPARLARACATVLAIDGAGLSVMDVDFRVPLGASDESATVAERLQFTQGEGPCLDAARGQRVLVADSDQIDRRWPSFGAEFFARTPFRGIAAIPISFAGSTRGALDLYFVDEQALASLRLADAAAVADAVLDALEASDAETADSVDQWTGRPMKSWLAGPSARRRRFVWLAVGMVMSRFGTGGPDALTLLRSYAYGNNIDLDELALGLVERRVALDELQI